MTSEKILNEIQYLLSVYPKNMASSFTIYSINKISDLIYQLSYIRFWYIRYLFYYIRILYK